MHIKSDQATLQQLKDELKLTFVGAPYTEGTMEAVQDATEHKLVTYDKDDIADEQFLSLHMIDSGHAEKIQLFVNADIFIEITFSTDASSGFKKIADFESIKVLQSGS